MLVMVVGDDQTVLPSCTAGKEKRKARRVAAHCSCHFSCCCHCWTMAERGQPTATVPSLASLTPLLGKVLRQYDAGVRAKSVNFYPSQVSVASQTVPGPSQSTSIPWTIRCVPALLEKAKSKAKAEEGKEAQRSPALVTLPQHKSNDVFAPPYHPDLLVEEMLEHTILVSILKWAAWGNGVLALKSLLCTS